MTTTIVSSGQTIRSGTVSSGTVEIVQSGATAIHLVVSSGGAERVLNGGDAGGTTLRGGALVVEGFANNTTVSNGGRLTIGAGATVDNVTVSSGGTIIDAGGTYACLRLENGATEDIAAGAHVYGLKVGSGTTMRVFSGGEVTGVAVRSGGRLVFDGGVITNIVVGSGGTEVVGAGIEVKSLSLTNGNILDVVSGGTAFDTTVAGGTETVFNGGTVGGTTSFTANSRLDVGAKGDISITVSGFKATDTLEFAHYKFGAKEKLAFVENAARTKGILTITDGTLKASVTLLGQYVAAGFHAAAAGAAGTAITYSASASSHADTALAAPHH